jgi:uncharacterized membrane protein
MKILVVILAGSLLLFRALGAVGVEALASWSAATRWALAVLLLVTATAHFNRMQQDLVRMMPAWMPRPRLTVQLTGLCELLGAAGILVPATRPAAGTALILFLIAVFPANVKAAREQLTLAGRPATPLWQRVPFQLLLIGLLGWVTLVSPGS